MRSSYFRFASLARSTAVALPGSGRFSFVLDSTKLRVYAVDVRTGLTAPPYSALRDRASPGHSIHGPAIETRSPALCHSPVPASRLAPLRGFRPENVNRPGLSPGRSRSVPNGVSVMADKPAPAKKPRKDAAAVAARLAARAKDAEAFGFVFTVRVDGPTIEKLRDLANKDKRSVSYVVRDMIADAIKK